MSRVRSEGSIDGLLRHAACIGDASAGVAEWDGFHVCTPGSRAGGHCLAVWTSASTHTACGSIS